jgi:hypothetical protein
VCCGARNLRVLKLPGLPDLGTLTTHTSHDIFDIKPKTLTPLLYLIISTSSIQAKHSDPLLRQSLVSFLLFSFESTKLIQALRAAGDGISAFHSIPTALATFHGKGPSTIRTDSQKRLP